MRWDDANMGVGHMILGLNGRWLQKVGGRCPDDHATCISERGYSTRSTA